MSVSIRLKSFSESGPTHPLCCTSGQVGELYAELYNWLQPGKLLSDARFHDWAEVWKIADPDTFHYPAVYMHGWFKDWLDALPAHQLPAQTFILCQDLVTHVGLVILHRHDELGVTSRGDTRS